MKAVIIIAGTELVRGRIKDSHVAFLSSSLFSMGIETTKAVILPDNPSMLENELYAACKEADIVFMSGGLGPTSDDHTRNILSAVSKKELVFVDELWDKLVASYPHLADSSSNRRQAMLPAGFSAIDNDNGTAPGIYGKIENALVFALPGPPSELVPMYEKYVAPLIKKYAGVKELYGCERMLSCFLIPESRIEDALADLALQDLSWATQAQAGRVLLILSSDKAEIVDRAVESLRAAFLPHLIIDGNVNIYELLLDTLKERGLILSAAESCTAGAFVNSFASVAGASAVLWGSFVVYSNEAKTRLLGVDDSVLAEHGAVSEPCVKAMLDGVFSVTPASVAVAISGIAGPSGGTAQKPVGTVFVGVGIRDGRSLVVRLSLRGKRERIMQKSALVAAVLAHMTIVYPELDTEGVKEYIENKLV